MQDEIARIEKAGRREDFICQVNKQYNYTNNRNTLTDCQGRYKPINGSHL